MSIPFILFKRASILGLLCLILIGPLNAQEKGAEKPETGTVPGVDPVPAAEYPEGDPRKAQAERAALEKQKPAPKKETPVAATNGATDKDAGQKLRADTAASETRSRFPLIRNIRVEPDREFPHSVRIRWDVDPSNDTAIYVGRYIRPLATRELILEAENLTSPPLGPNTTSYLDRNIPDGAYYYVVVTTFEMSKRNTVVLQANVNYTTTPSVIFREGRPDTNTNPDTTQNEGRNALEVSNLFAVNSGDTVKLSWRPPDRSNVRYNIYRSDAPLDSPGALQSATRLAVVQGQQYIYEDRNPVLDRQVFYGVSITDLANNREEQKLYLNRSFIAHTYGKSKPSNESNDQIKSLPDALTAFLAGKDTVRLLWVEPESGGIRDYRIYRSSRPINSTQALRDAALIGTVSAGESGYRDSRLRSGTYYYAVLPRDTRGREIRNFTEGRTFTGFAVNIGEADSRPEPSTDANESTEDLEFTKDQRESLKEPVVEYLQARGGPDQVELNWSIARADLSSFQTLLFRSDKPMTTLKQIREWGTRVATLPGAQRSYTDVGLDAGRYYYAIILDFSDHVQETMTAGRNYLAFPIVVGGRTTNVDPVEDNRARPDYTDPDFDGSLYKLNRVLALTYHKKLYGEAIRRLAPFISSARIADNVRAKALLYTGLSLYHTRQYRTSLDYFLQDLVRENYPERADFWYNRSIKRLR